jgi:hypothetical protein
MQFRLAPHAKALPTTNWLKDYCSDKSKSAARMARARKLVQRGANKLGKWPQFCAATPQGLV